MTNIAVSERQHWVGASESAALFGESPYKTKFQLWHEKAGNITPDDLDESERVQAGQFFEPSIAAWAAHKWEMGIVKVREYRVSPHVAGMGCSLDYLSLDGEPVEIKNVDSLEFKKKFEYKGDTLVDAPAHFLIQVQHQIACPPRDEPMAERGWLVVCVGGNRLFRMQIPRHDRMIGRIEEEIAAFWASIERNESPPPNFARDADAIGLLYQGDGGETADLRGNARARELAEHYLAQLAIETTAQKAKQAALAELKFMLNGARGAQIDGGYKVSAAHIDAQVINKSAHWRFRVSGGKQEK